MWRIVVVILVGSHFSLAEAQQHPPESVTGSEQSTNLKSNQQAPQLPSEKTAEELEAKIQELNGRISAMESKVRLGGDVLTKWAGMAERLARFVEHSGKWKLQCEVNREKLVRAERRQSSPFFLPQLRAEIKHCEKEGARNDSLLIILKGKLDAIDVTVKTIDLEMRDLGDIVDQKLKEKKVLEMEKDIVTQINGVNNAISDYNTK